MNKGEQSFYTDDDIKLVVLGIGAVGKSSITLRFTQGQFEEEYNPTIQETFFKTVPVDDKPATLEILDTAGYEEYEVMQEMYIKQGQGFILVYAIDKKESFEEIKKIKKRVDRMNDYKQVSAILVGNKCDLINNIEVTTEEGQQLANELNAQFIEASAKSGFNCDEIFYNLVRDIRQKQTPIFEPKEESFWKNFFSCNLV